jgi:N-acetylglutamate synthase-like GNAT family acetyltransferase
MLTIRRFEKEDIDEITHLTTDLGYQTTVEQMKSRMEKICLAENVWTFIAQTKNKIVGYVGFSKNFSWEQDGDFLRIQALVVKNGERKKGVGKKLVQFVEKFAKEIDANSIVLNCGNRTEREDAHNFYKKIGFEVKTTGYRKQVTKV